MDEWATLAYREGVSANLEAAQDIQKRTQRLLLEKDHLAGTRTPSPPGAAPATITGRLAASIQASHDGDDAIVGPTVAASSNRGPYGRFLELGGDHAAHSPRGMWWREDGRWHRADFLRKAPRPFLKPSTDDAIESGAIHDIYWRHWLIAQEAVTS
jgi:hypothetical protein